VAGAPRGEITPPTLADLEALAERALETIPDELKRHLGPLVFRVEEFPDEEIEEEMGLESPFDILGLYRGVSLPRKSMFDTLPAIDMVFLYRRPILDEWAERGDVALEELVTHVLVHEIGHHFGLSDAQIAEIESRA
jgi:predicted Zn-dependent protease with MMP-like domain